MAEILDYINLFSIIRLKSKQSNTESVMRGCSLREHSSIYLLRRGFRSVSALTLRDRGRV
jgi:hypothetical protein